MRGLGRKIVSITLAIILVFAGFPPVFQSDVQASVTGGTYFVGEDNWGGGAADSAPDNDFDIKIGNIDSSNSIGYPIEFKFTNIPKPQKSAYLLIRALDVDEEDGEWDRVYISADPKDIVLKLPNEDSGNNYDKEFSNVAYVGALSGNNNTWNTSVIPIENLNLFIDGTNNYYVGISTHHNYNVSGSKQGWVVQVDWAQLVIDGGGREKGEIKEVNVTPKSGKLEVDTIFIPKDPGKYYIEINVVEENNGLKQNLVTKKQEIIISEGQEGKEYLLENIELGGSGTYLDPTKDYEINVILFDNSGGGYNDANTLLTTQHIYSVTTADPKVNSFSKMNVPQYEIVEFTQSDFTSNFSTVNGTVNNHLSNVQIVTLPNSSLGKLVLVNGSETTDVVAGQIIDKEQLGQLRFIPSESGITETVSFKWNGYDSQKQKYAFLDADVIISPNTSPVLADLVKEVDYESLTDPKEIGFTLSDFVGTSEKPIYLDGEFKAAESSSLTKIKIVLLPDASKGKLVFGDGETHTDVVQGEEIPANEVNKLKFIPNEGVIGEISFDWNASDDIQFAKEPKKVKIQIYTDVEITLTANPQELVGNGNTSTVLTTIVKDKADNPVQGVQVIFAVPGDTGEFEGSNIATTNSEGIATVAYKPAKMTGNTIQEVTVTANVKDPIRGLEGQDNIKVTYYPGKVTGVIKKGNSNTPIVGANVRIIYDKNNNGVIEEEDFEATVVTDENGAYSVFVPYGNVDYQIEVTQNISVGGVNTPVTYKQTAKVDEISGSGNENYASEETITGVVLFKKPDGSTSLVGDQMKDPENNEDYVKNIKVYLKDNTTNEYIKDSNGDPKPFSVDPNGLFHADGLDKGKEYTLEISYEVAPGLEIIISKSTVEVSTDGELNITEELVDPYGTITDSATNANIQGAKVTLYYADTPNNIVNGKTPNTEVTLPKIIGFAPNDNASPVQYTDGNGFYAYMVYPDTDYYLVVEKAGYYTYTSPTIQVGKDIVKHDAQLTPIVYSPPSTPNVTLNLTVDKNLVEEGTQSSFIIDYKNLSSVNATNMQLKVTLPKGAKVIDAAGGTVNGNEIVWSIGSIGANDLGQYKVLIEWPVMDKEETAVDVLVELITNNNVSNPVLAKSTAKIKVFSKRFAPLKHQRYILGYPDGEFKPNRNLLRAELAAIVARLTENEIINEPLRYSDVSENYWAANYIKIVTKHGFFTGFTDGTFRPNEPVTRGELAAARFLKLDVSTPSQMYFTDVKGHWAMAAIEELYRGKFIAGYADKTFKPSNYIIRSEAVTMINSMLYRGPLLGLKPVFPDVNEKHWAFGNVQEATISHESIRNTDGSEQYEKTLPDNVK